MIKVDFSLVVQIANFVFLIWMLNRVLYTPIRKALLKRKDRIEGLEQGIRNANQNARSTDESLVSGLKAARDRGLLERNDLVSFAEDEEKRIIHTIQMKAQEDMAAVRNKIVKETTKVRETLQQEIDGFVRSICQKILGRTVE